MMQPPDCGLDVVQDPPPLPSHQLAPYFWIGLLVAVALVDWYLHAHEMQTLSQWVQHLPKLGRFLVGVAVFLLGWHLVTGFPG